MHDTPFVNQGQDIEDYLPVGALKSTANDSLVTYNIANVTMTSTGTTWQAYGSHAGVSVNITMEVSGQEFLHVGNFSQLSDCPLDTPSANSNCTGSAGGIVHAVATGTISFNDTTLVLDQAYSVHERLIQGGSVPSRIQNSDGIGAFWMHAWGQRLSFFTFTADTQYATGEVTIDGQTYVSSGVANTSIETIGSWLDPKSNQLIPYKWTTFAILDFGRMDATVTAYGRLYYYWVRDGGLIITYQFVADAETTFVYTNGTTISEEQPAFIEYFRTFYIQTHQ